MNRQEVLEKLCEICTRVNEKHFDWDYKSDCFCGDNKYSPGEFDEEIIDFISEAVDEKILKFALSELDEGVKNG